MREAIHCRLKMTLWLALFFSPVIVGLWGQRADQAITENAFLPAPDMNDSLALIRHTPSYNSNAGIDLSED